MAQLKECDGCALCCKLLEVEELNKPACRWCSEVKRSEHGRSCGIYAQRPTACREFSCYWLFDEAWLEELRPDRCHVVFATDAYLNGPFQANSPVLYAIVDPDWPDAWRRHRIMTIVMQAWQRKTPDGVRGQVVVTVGNWWRHYRKDGSVRQGRGDLALGTSLGAFVWSRNLPPGIPPTFDPDEFAI